MRYCLTTALLAVFAAFAAFAVPAVYSSLLSNGSLADREQLTSNKVAAGPARAHTTAGGKPSVVVLASYPHDTEAFTQGLLVARQGNDKFFIESTGLYGKSTLRKVEIETGKVETKHDFDSKVFGEGVTLGRNGELVMITWQEKRGFTFSLSPAQSSGGSQFKLQSEFPYETFTSEGWGIDYDGKHLVVSDGSEKIMFWDPATKTSVREITVTYEGDVVKYVNELEVANGFIYANVWYEKVIVKIDPADGKVVAVFDCTKIMAQSGATPGDTNAVLNGIAYDGDEDVFYLTGKLWGRVFKVRLQE
jgi:glutaminyl-peptide cyclotransferase